MARWSRRRRIVIGSAAFVLGIGMLLAITLASLTQTDRGRALIMRALVPTIAANIPGKLYVGRVSGTLFSGFTVDTIDIREPNGRPFFSSGPITVEYDPRDLIDGRVIIKSLDMVRPRLTLVDYGNDDWNWKRALRRERLTPKLPRRAGSLGKYIVLDTATLHDVHFVAMLPWELSDTLKGAKRDSALKFNLTRLDGEIRPDGDRLVRIWRFVRGSVAIGNSRIASPDSAGQRIAVRKLDVVWVYPPFWFRNVSTSIRRLGDSLWIDDARLELAHSRGRAKGKVVWGSKLPVRYDINIQGDSVALEDVAWIDETLPHSGGGTMALNIRNDPRDLRVIEYRLRNMDAKSLRSRILGNMTFAVGGPVLRVDDVSLDLSPAHTDLLRFMNGEPFPFDWQGELRGHVTARGGPVHRFVIDNAALTYSDAHVPGAISRVQARGMANIFTPAEAILLGVDVRLESLDLRTPRYVNPLFPELNGFVRGTVRLDSLWYDATFSNADLEHVDGPGLPSHITGNGTYTLLPEGVRFDVDVQAAPVSYTTLSRSYPSLPLRGSANGRIQARGMAENFELHTALAGDGGELAFDGHADALEPVYGATGTYRLRGVNLQSLLELSTVPVTSLSMSGAIDVTGADLASLKGPLSAVVDQFSRVADARLFGATARVVFDSGHMHVDTLSVESSALRLRASGGLGLIASRTDSVNVSISLDSLGGMRSWLAPADGRGFLPANTDTLRGTIELRGALAGSFDTLAPGGLQLRLRGDARDIAVGANRVAHATASVDLTQLLQGGDGLVRLVADSTTFSGFAVSNAVGNATFARGIAERFGAQLRTPSDARVVVSGGVQHLADTNTITFDTIDVRVDPATPNRRMSLQAPAVVRVVNNNSGRLDSLVLVHSDTGRLAIRGGVADDGGISGKFDLERFPLLDLGQLSRTPMLRGGYLTTNALLGGTVDAPIIESRISFRDAVVGRVRLSALDATANYARQRLVFDAAASIGTRRAMEATGSLPLDLALRAGHTRLIDEPLTGHIVSRDADLSLLETLLPYVKNATGSFSTDVQLTGSWASPRLRGAVQIADGAMNLENLGIRLERAHADVLLAGDTIHVRSLGATSGGRTDTIGVSGLIGIREVANPFFDLRLTARNFLAMEKPRAASLTVTTTQPISLYGPQNAATVRGALRVDRGRIYVNALTQRRGLDLADNYDAVDTAFGMNALLPKAPAALVQNLVVDNVNIDIGDDVWLRSPEANIKLGGALRVTRSRSRDDRTVLALSDSLTVERGTYTLNLGIVRPNFEVERGVIRFFGDPDIEPALDITALHTIRELRPNSNRQDVRIRVNIGGTTTQPTLTLSSADNPPLSESDMLSYLVTGEPAYALLGTSYSEQGATLLLRFTGSLISSRLAGGRFDVVQVEPTAVTLAPGETGTLQNYSDILRQTRIGVGGQIAKNTYVTLSTALCAVTTAGDPLSLFAQGLGLKVERRFERNLAVSLGLEPSSSALACGRAGISRTFQQTPPQLGFDFFRTWTF